MPIRWDNLHVGWIAHHVAKPKARLRLFTFPYGGGGASIFKEWSNALPDEIEVCPVQLPGREDRSRETPCTKMSSLIHELTTALTSFADLPFAFFGHSMGALIAFELARQLGSIRGRLLHVFVSSCRAAHTFTGGLGRHLLSDSQLVHEMRRLGTPEQVLHNNDLLSYVLPVMRADFELVDTYSYTPGLPLHCELSAYGAAADVEVSTDDLLSWSQHTDAGFHVRVFEGNHFYLRTRVPSLIAAILTDMVGHLPSKP